MNTKNQQKVNRKPFPITHKILMDWAGKHVYHEAKAAFNSGRVRKVEYDHPVVRGQLEYGARGLNSEFLLLPDGFVENKCPCRNNTEHGMICSHIITLAMELIRRQTDPEREQKAREEMRRAARLEEIEEGRYLSRVSADHNGAIPARLRLTLAAHWQDELQQGVLSLDCRAHYGTRRCDPLDEIAPELPLAFSKQDENILFVLEDISEGPAKGKLKLIPADFINILKLHAGSPLYQEGRKEPLTVNAADMSSVLRMDLDRENGELILMVHTELPFMDSSSFPVYIIAGREGWVYDAGHFWHLEALLPGPLQSIYQKPVYIERPSVPQFMQTEFPLIREHIQVETDITYDLLSIEPAQPRFRLAVKGSPASLAATLYAEYAGLSLIACKNDAQGQFAIPDPNDLLGYRVRNPKQEEMALEQLRATGFAGTRGDDLESIKGCREVLNFLGGGLPGLRRMGWKVTLEGRVEPFMDSMEFATPVVHVEAPTSSQGWMEVGFEFENQQGQSLQESEIQRAIMKGESYFESSGRVILFDTDAITTARDVFNDCSGGSGSKPGTFKMDPVYSGYLQSSLDALDGIDVEANRTWQKSARSQNRASNIQPFALTGNLDQILRPYQKEGVYWLRFLENNHLCGILADEMGLGKTLQTLSWLALQRVDDSCRNQPSLLVCPTSLVENWAEESARFTPDLRVLIISGADRKNKLKQIDQADLVVTSYALMRRDVDHYLATAFAAIILDEAQHIKNRSTQNAVAAKKLKAIHRLVLTGTPIENSVADLWSIMDFLMPGYLGGHKTFREYYELPIDHGGPEAISAQTKLRRKLHPFLMRRMKIEVAKDLPAKIERIASCTLSKDQQLVYKELVESSQRRIFDMVMKDGFNRSRMEILKTLLRLRQTCCHLDLLKLPDLNSEYPSAKMALFFELLDEALDGGHRILVFSQFTSMLAILRKELETRNRPYCYLDGSTKDRLKVVHEFNSTRDIPVFLISLKAGGTGLNLTGADMVIHFDPWWNPAVEDQATDRAHRIGQKRTVYSIKLITKGTVEEKVLAMQRRKKSVINATLTKDEQVMQKLTWEDVQELLTF